MGSFFASCAPVAVDRTKDSPSPARTFSSLILCCTRSKFMWKSLTLEEVPSGGKTTQYNELGISDDKISLCVMFAEKRKAHKDKKYLAARGLCQRCVSAHTQRGHWSPHLPPRSNHSHSESSIQKADVITVWPQYEVTWLDDLNAVLNQRTSISCTWFCSSRHLLSRSCELSKSTQHWQHWVKNHIISSHLTLLKVIYLILSEPAASAPKQRSFYSSEEWRKHWVGECDRFQIYAYSIYIYIAAI